MKYALYQSRALIPDEPRENDSILAVSRKNNQARRISGFLYREGDHFLQYLEGDPETLDALLAKIAQDPRHSEMHVIDSGHSDKRRFPDWQMGYLMPYEPALCDLVETDADGWAFLVEDPFDLVVFLSSNADLLRDSAA
jgi:hypothetical protein